MIKYKHPNTKEFPNRVLTISRNFDEATKQEQINFFTVDEANSTGCKGTMLDRTQVEHLVRKLSAWLKGDKDVSGSIVGDRL